jgi:hypothetical protein
MIAPKHLIDGMKEVHYNMIGNGPAPLQEAIARAFEVSFSKHKSRHLTLFSLNYSKKLIKLNISKLKNKLKYGGKEYKCI